MEVLFILGLYTFWHDYRAQRRNNIVQALFKGGSIYYLISCGASHSPAYLHLLDLHLCSPFYLMFLCNYPVTTIATPLLTHLPMTALAGLPSNPIFFLAFEGNLLSGPILACRLVLTLRKRSAKKELGLPGSSWGRAVDAFGNRTQAEQPSIQMKVVEETNKDSEAGDPVSLQKPESVQGPVRQIQGIMEVER